MFPDTSQGDVQTQVHSGGLEDIPMLRRILNALPAMAMVLNSTRHVVIANQALSDFAGAAEPDELIGLRPGDIFECVNASTGEGCGSTAGCAFCGGSSAIETAFLGRSNKQLCRMRRGAGSREEPLELEVSAAPVEIAGQRFMLVYSTDASSRLRREWLERTFIPYAELLARQIEALVESLNSLTDTATRERALRALQESSRRLSSLVRQRGKLAAAEEGRLAPAFRPAPAARIIAQTLEDLASDSAREGRNIRVAPGANASADTDAVLARCILRNMLLNALEATPPGGTVQTGWTVDGDKVKLWVRNEGELTDEVRVQIWQRAYSTKGPGRGYGAYFTKLLAERFLEGEVGFGSSAQEGTTFFVRLPLAKEDNAEETL